MKFIISNILSWFMKSRNNKFKEGGYIMLNELYYE